jgi:hypothetical protein
MQAFGGKWRYSSTNKEGKSLFLIIVLSVTVDIRVSVVSK